ncbi:PHP domain-containing protein [Cellulomonas citrea]|uniref:PHP domain-containing protein n=1 Tax=Cellulomonas citrea TaxID=1909423 RepID=UPI00135A5B89|nr:PHP domain-containing protein [Cellulomonas citrea]
MRVDLHTHSSASDGTQPPEVLVAAARDAGLDVVALTDHDTTAGWAAARAAALALGTTLVLGTEMSTRYDHRSVHLLCYLQDPGDAALVAELETIRTARLGRAREMVDKIAADLPITWDDVQAQVEDGASVGRPHIADALVAAGVVPDRSAAFADLLHGRGPYYVPHYAPSTDHAIALVLAAGGVPVLAHPGAADRGRVLADAAFDELAAAGLVGIEVHHRDHDAAQVRRLGAIAERLGLLVTGSSDYHGEGKPNLLGENLTDPAVLAQIAERGTTEVVRP